MNPSLAKRENKKPACNRVFKSLLQATFQISSFAFFVLEALRRSIELHQEEDKTNLYIPCAEDINYGS